MGVYIRGMQMPRSCMECPLPCTPECVDEYDACGEKWRRARMESCPMVEVATPHGRLIDSSETVLVDVFDKFMPEPLRVYMTVEEMLEYYDVPYTPTVVEAEG